MAEAAAAPVLVGEAEVAAVVAVIAAVSAVPAVLPAVGPLAVLAAGATAVA